MKKVKYVYMKDCPYCRKADSYIESLCRLNPDYGRIAIERIEAGAQADRTASCDYYVPAFFVDGVKLHEGVATLEKVKAVLDAALK